MNSEFYEKFEKVYLKLETMKELGTMIDNMVIRNYYQDIECAT